MTRKWVLIDSDWLLLLLDAVDDLAEASQPFEELDAEAYMGALRQMDRTLGGFRDAVLVA